MKKIYLIILILFSVSINSQNLIGAWERVQENDSGILEKQIVIFTTQGYQSISIFNAKTGEFIYTNGGTWELNGENLTEKVEFDTANPERVGSETTFKIIINENSINVPIMGRTWTRLDNGGPGKLEGAWLMGGRYRNGNKQMRSIDGPRKTMKLLSGKRFQWIAYNTATKQFMGTGGGTYTTENGIYYENVEFFSRDNSKAGIKLKFDYELINGEWNHKGFSSKGDPLHEIWVKRNN
ncbi:membrane or secreted protein [Flavobacteriales bacterium]|nr:membrane or secreted protein [Flavobacteriales bacterium]